MKAAALQMVSGTGVAANLAAARVLLAEAAADGVELAVLPEYFCLMGHADTDKLAVQERFGDGPIQAFLARAAQDFGLCIVGGTLPLATTAGDDGQRVRNASLVFAPDGRCIARYDKMHRFRFDNGRERYDETRLLEAGDTPCWFDMASRAGPRWRIGLSVCYDLRFPELYRHYAAAGCDLLLVPSAFTHATGSAHWEVLLRARAIENLAYVLAPAQGGLHENGRRTWGHSCCIDPWGHVMAVREEGAAVVAALLDAAHLSALRTQLPALSHRMLP